MKLPKGREKILLALHGKGAYEDENLVPYSTCQQGLSDGLDVSQARIAQLVNALKEKDLLKEKKKHIVGLKRQRKAYFLTSKGYQRGKKIREELKEKTITVQTENSEEKIKLDSIEKYVDSEDPLITALNKIDDEGKVDLRETQEETKEIFVNRKEELNKLKEVSESLKEEGNKAIFIKGEAGIGKTSLISKFKKDFLTKNYNFVAGRAYFDKADPYLPFKEAFKGHREENGVYFPFYEEGKEKTQNEEIERRSIFYKTVETIECIASEKPLVIFLDDLQWADSTTLQLFYYLADNTRESPVLFLGAYRPKEVSDDDLLIEIIQRMSRAHIYDEIKLRALDWTETEKILKNLVERDRVPEEFVRLIHDITEGNPLFIKECTKQLLDEGSVEGKEGIYPKSKDEIKIPRIINDIIDKWIKKLDQQTKRVLEISSVIGEKVPFELLPPILDMDDLELMNHLDILVGADLWDDEPNEEIFYFSHGLIQLAVYENIPGTIRKRYHQKIGETIEDLYEDEIDEHFSELALHFEKGGRVEDSIDYYLKSGKKAEDMYAHENAIQMYQKSLSLMKEIGKPKSDEVDILERLGDAFRVMGKYEKSRDNFNRGIEETEDKEVKAKLYCKVGGTYLDQGDYDSALKGLKKGLDILEEEDGIRCRLLDKKGWALMRRGDLQKVKTIFQEERNIAEKIDDTKEKAQAVHNQGVFYLKKGEYGNAKKRFKKAVELWEEIEDKRGLSSSYNNLGVVYSNKGNLDESLNYLNKSLEIVKEIGDIRSVSLTLLNIGEEYYNKGELDKALEKYDESLSAKEKIDDKEGMAFCHNYIGEVYREKDRLSDAEESHEEGLDIAEEIKNQKMIINSLLSLAQDKLESSEVEEGLSLAKEAFEKIEESGLKSKRYRARRTIGKGYRLNNEFDRADEILKEALEEIGEGGDKKEKGKILYELGVLWAEENEETSESYLKRALKTFEDIGMELWRDKTKEKIP
ncbi:MAG: tetratricopeptide repeat protein [Candidatus Thermoplasmatota archaeon]